LALIGAAPEFGGTERCRRRGGLACRRKRHIPFTIGGIVQKDRRPPERLCEADERCGRRRQFREESMKFDRKLMLTAIISVVVGAGAVQLLHAQTTPPAYNVAMINVKDEEGYKKDFLPEAQKMIKEGGGKYIAGGWNKTTTMDGPPPPNRVIILQFESASAIKKWWEGGLEKLQKEVGHKYADFQTFAVEGVEQK
jgi:uncharacterized protein (DUF1330 family)